MLLLKVRPLHQPRSPSPVLPRLLPPCPSVLQFRGFQAYPDFTGLLGLSTEGSGNRLQGYLADKKAPLPVGLPSAPWHTATVGS